MTTITEQSNILLMTKDSATVNALNAALNENLHVALTAVCQDVSELMKHLANALFKAVMIDIDPDPSRLLQDVATITAMYPEMRVVVASSGSNNELILQAMQSGARYFLSKESITSELNKVLKQIVLNGTKNEVKSGSIVSVISASGGCGATTVAINLANELRLASSETVLAIDLDNYYKTISSYLGISSKYGISDVLTHSEAIDEHLVRSCAYDYMQDFHVLVNHNGIMSPKGIRYKNIVSMLEACKKAYKYTVIDAPRLTDSIIEDLAKISEFVLIVFQLTVKDMKFAQSLMSSVQVHIPSDRIIPLANRFKKGSSLIGLKDGKKVLGTDCLYHIRNDWRKITSCINSGRLLADVAPRSRLRKDFQKLTDNIVKAAGLNGNGNGNGNGKILG